MNEPGRLRRQLRRRAPRKSERSPFFVSTLVRREAVACLCSVADSGSECALAGVPRSSGTVGRSKANAALRNKQSVATFVVIPSAPTCEAPAGSCKHGGGEVAEWSNAAVSKTVKGASPSRVRIPPSPPVWRRKPWKCRREPLGAILGASSFRGQERSRKGARGR